MAMSTSEQNPAVEQLKANTQAGFDTLKSDVQAVLDEAGIPDRVGRPSRR